MIYKIADLYDKSVSTQLPSGRWVFAVPLPFYGNQIRAAWAVLWWASRGAALPGVLVGQIARCFGRGFGYTVRGVVIGDRVVRYQTAEEAEVERIRQSKAFNEEVAAQEAEAKAAGRDEAEMRASDAPWPKTLEELTAYVKSVTDGPHTYGTVCYAASLATVATFNYVCGTQGMSSFQASCADLDIIRRTRNINGPFMILKGEDALYPQHDLPKKLREAMEDWLPWLAEEAQKNLAEKDIERAHPKVVAHWKKLAGCHD